MDTKALRQKILDLAIRGKLVPQDPNDEPASVLLERIRAEKQQMVKDGKLKAKDIKNDTVIFLGDDNLHYEKFPDGTVKYIEDEIPFELPEGWEWTRIGNLFTTITGSTPSTKDKSLYGDEFPFYKPTDLDKGINVVSSTDYVSEKGYNSGRVLPEKSVLVTCIGATIGKTGMIHKTGICNQQINAIIPNIFVLPEYTFFLLNSLYMQEQILTNSSATTLPILNKSKFDSLLIPLTPLVEQKRIVSKITELLSFIDTIESDKTDLKTTIQLTKSKILDLAISGKLVSQNPDDEPASALLERIRAEKEELIKHGKIKRDKKESVIYKGDDNSYYLKMGNVTETLDDWRIDDIPDNWGVCCLGEVCDYGNCTNVDTKDIPETAWILDLEDIEKDTGKVLQKLTLKERNSASTKHLFHKGQVLYSKLRPYLNKVVLADDDGFCTSEILPLDFNGYILPEYAKCYMMSPTFLRYANHCSYGVKMPRLGTLDGKKAVLTVPPINEQKRIADKVSQLFSLLDSIAENIN